MNRVKENGIEMKTIGIDRNTLGIQGMTKKEKERELKRERRKVSMRGKERGTER